MRWEDIACGPIALRSGGQSAGASPPPLLPPLHCPPFPSPAAQPDMSLRIGVDCGGTNTDAVVLDDTDQVLGWAKRTTTTPDVLAGVREAVSAALRDAGRGKRCVPDMRQVMS